jgi:hypothetical protein
MSGLLTDLKAIMRPLHLLPVNDSKFDNIPEKEVECENLQWLDNLPFVPMKSGRECIKYLCEMLGLGRQNEIWITTTSETAFVSSCVTSSAFNFSAVSRFFSERTKLIIVIHEFGFPHPGIIDIAKFAKARGIPMLEDCAYSFSSKCNGRRIGTFGDFALYSLPKVFPVSGGGLLVGCSPCTNNRFYDEDASPKILANLRQNMRRIEYDSTARREVFQWWKNSLPDFPIVYPLNEAVPSVFGFKHSVYKQIHQSLEPPVGEVELARTYNEDWVLVPSHQFIKYDQIESVAAKIQEIVESGS